MRTEGRTEMTRLIGAFRDYAKAAKMRYLSIFKLHWHLCLLIANESYVLKASEYHA
jgi:hypothetical protein